jgi:hypothetical protein
MGGDPFFANEALRLTINACPLDAQVVGNAEFGRFPITM